jgi:heat shock protein HslJ
MHNNSFPIHSQKPSTRKLVKRQETTQTAPKKWATVTYTGKETTFITNIFRRTNLKIAFPTNNTIGNWLMHKQQITDRHT